MAYPRPESGKVFVCNPCGKAFFTPVQAPKEWADWARADGVSPCCGATYMEDYSPRVDAAPLPLPCGHLSHENGGPSDYGQECR